MRKEGLFLTLAQLLGGTARHIHADTALDFHQPVRLELLVSLCNRERIGALLGRKKLSSSTVTLCCAATIAASLSGPELIRLVSSPWLLTCDQVAWSGMAGS